MNCTRFLMTKPDPEPSPFRVLALDGGAASGKSSTARLLASRHHLLYVETGSHYRAVTRACLDAGLPPVEGPELRAFLARLQPESRIAGQESRVAFAGHPPPDPASLRTPEVNAAVSRFAALPAVRHMVRDFQRDQVRLARENGFRGIVMEGRDIGTVVLPGADLKVFLTADPATRQDRRNREGGADAVSDRDAADASRPLDPLRPAPDAVVIDNSSLPLEAVAEAVSRLLLRLPGECN